MWAIVDKIPYSILIVIAVFMLLAPFKPMSHVFKKFIMLKNGTLTKPIDIFDLFFHLFPTIILLLKIYRSFSKQTLMQNRKGETDDIQERFNGIEKEYFNYW